MTIGVAQGLLLEGQTKSIGARIDHHDILGQFIETIMG